jgi:serine/threonine protein kinase
MLRCPKCTRPVSAGDHFCPACGAPLVTPTSAPTELSEDVAHPAPRAFTPGTMLAGRYRIVAFVGRGGMGEVYRADDLRLGEAVALKFLPEDVAGDPARRKRFDDEVRLARTIAHPNVCRVYDVGESDGRTFLTMEYVDGEDLVSLLRRIGRLPAAKGVEIARQLCAGLSAAHERGVLHRDLKPANVMIDGRGHAKITDFGLAVPDADAADALDGAGTPAYMSPERLAGQPATVQADLYALGLVFYEVFTGKRAFEAGSLAEWKTAHASSIPSRPSSHVADLDPAAETAMLRCLEKDPAKRPASAAQLARMLPGGDPLAAAIAAGETPSPELVAAAGEAGTLSVRRATAWLGVALLATAIAVFASSRYATLNLIPVVKPPEVLEDNALRILKALGHQTHPVVSWWFTVWDPGSESKAVRLADVGSLTPSPARFVYRSSPRPLDPVDREAGVRVDDPQPYWSGESRVITDTTGALIGLLVLPDEQIPPTPAAVQPVDWSAAFRLAELDPAAFAEAEPQWAPFIPADERKAWVPKAGDPELRIEGTAWRGRINRFALLRPSQPALRMGTYHPPLRVVFANSLWVVMILIALVTLGVLARRNLRLDRAYHAGAIRSAWLAGTLTLGALIPVQSWRADFEFIWGFLLECGGVSLFSAFSGWLAYVGLEPYLRRNAPHRLVGLTRLFEGRWRDPLVGREVLYGTAIGASLVACWSLAWIVGVPLGWEGLSALRTFGVNRAATFWSDLLYVGCLGFLNAWVFTAAALVLRLVLRRETFAWIAFGMLAAGTSASLTLPSAPKLVVLIALGLLTVLAFRTGQLCATVMLIVSELLRETPIAFDRWYAWRGYVVLAIVLIFAVVGFRVAIGKKRLLPAAR